MCSEVAEGGAGVALAAPAVALTPQPPSTPSTPSRAERAGTAAIVLEARGLGKCYHIYERPADRLKQALVPWGRPYYRDFWALRDLSLELRRGEALGVLGRNGSGKSTLLQLIAGTLSPTTGNVRVAGRVAALLELGSGFNPEFTGRENVYLNGAILGLSRRDVDERFDAIADFADIGEFLDQPVKTYSSGMMVRLAFAVQVQVEPDLLIVDEALAVGDALFQKRCYQRIDELRAKGTTLLFVSHDQETVRSITDRAILLDQGRVRATGSSAEVLLEYRRLLHAEERRWFAAHVEAKAKGAAGATVRAEGLQDSPTVSRAALDFGDLDGEITGVRVMDECGNACAYFGPGQLIRIRIDAVAKKALTNLNLGLRIRNKQGVKMYSWGTLNQDIATWARVARGEAPEHDVFWDRRFEAGEAFAIECVCECALGEDVYEVQASLSLEADRYYGAQRILHWRDEAAFFQVGVPRHEYFFGGVCDLRMRAHAVQ
jgi:lipopolysaccharide transport system ATP-binding protein